jgi:hypothetical protein
MLVQDALVTLAAIAAASIVLRRVFTTVGPTAGSSCASCPSAQRHNRRQDAAAAPRLGGDAQPLIVLKPTQR